MADKRARAREFLDKYPAAHLWTDGRREYVAGIMTDFAESSKSKEGTVCPTCGSDDPSSYPIVDSGGLCRDKWHKEEWERRRAVSKEGPAALDIYTAATKLALRADQVVDATADYYITLRQLGDICRTVSKEGQTASLTITLEQRANDPDIWVARLGNGWVTTGEKGEALRNMAEILEREGIPQKMAAETGQAQEAPPATPESIIGSVVGGAFSRHHDVRLEVTKK